MCKTIEGYRFNQAAFSTNTYDSCCYFLILEGTLVGLLGFYVDDFTVAGISEFVNDATRYLTTVYDIKHRNNPPSFLGHELVYKPSYIHLHQSIYIEKQIKGSNLDSFVATHKPA